MLTHWRGSHIFLQTFIKLRRLTVCRRFLYVEKWTILKHAQILHITVIIMKNKKKVV